MRAVCQLLAQLLHPYQRSHAAVDHRYGGGFSRHRNQPSMLSRGYLIYPY